MPQARRNQVSLEATSTYHCISRCVRRQFLCGLDPLTGRDFSHRRDGIRQRIFELRSVFAIDVLAYAVMSNHVHLVLRVDQQRALDWDAREVGQRWTRLFGGSPMVRSFVAGERLSEAQLSAVDSRIAEYRSRLYDISWFMRCLNEAIARWANAEDHVTGRFWEGRFKSQALLDEAAVIAAMAYVDLNPIRAAMAETPEESDYTSVQQRILEQNPQVTARAPEAMERLPEDLQTAIGRLAPFSDQEGVDTERAIPFSVSDYLDLVDWSGRAIVEGKRGRIPDHLPPILQRLRVDPDHYVRFIRKVQKGRFHAFIGSVEAMRDTAKDVGRAFLKGQAAAARLFSPG